MKRIVILMTIYFDLVMSFLLLPLNILITPPVILVRLAPRLPPPVTFGYFALFSVSIPLSAFLAFIFYLACEYAAQGGTYGKIIFLLVSLSGVNLSVLSLSGIDISRLVLTNLIAIPIYILVIWRDSQSKYIQTKTRKLW